MKILAVSSRIPAEGKKGDQVVSFHRIKHLINQGHKVELICFGDSRKAEDNELKKILESEGVAVTFIIWSPIEAVFNLFMAVGKRGLPFQCAFFRSKSFQRKVHEAFVCYKPDVVYGVMIRIMTNVRCERVPFFVDMVDSMGLNFARRASAARGFKRFLLKIECARVRCYERSIAELSCKSFVVSKIDKYEIASRKVEAIPLGINTHIFRPMPGDVNFDERSRIVFSGNMSYEPNVDAIKWFYENCWADILEENPNALLVITGNNPHAKVTEIGEKDKSVQVTGRVNSIAEVLNSAIVSIAPMQSGSGMQFKVLEAMACGLPVVVTKLGLGDIAATTFKEVVLADSPEEFSHAVIKLIKEKDLRCRLGRSAVKYVIENHSWDSVNSLFSEILDKSFVERVAPESEQAHNLY